MATKLLKSVTRELVGTTVGTNDKYRDRPITVTLEAGDVLIFRIKGTQQCFEVPLAHCFRLAQIMELEHKYRKAMDDYKAKKKAGYKRLRKPKRGVLPFSKLFFEATKNGG